MVEVKNISNAEKLPAPKNPTRMFGKTDPDKKPILDEHGDYNLDDYRVETA